MSDETVSLSLLDTAGQEEYDRLRSMVYCNAHVVLVCFAVDDRNSYANVRLKWLPEIRQFCPDVAMVLVATKVDLRGASGPKADADVALTCAEGQELATDIGAAAYVECSSRLKQGLDDVFQAAARATLSCPSKRNNSNPDKEKKRKSAGEKNKSCIIS